MQIIILSGKENSLNFWILYSSGRERGKCFNFVYKSATYQFTLNYTYIKWKQQNFPLDLKNKTFKETEISQIKS